MKKMKSRTPKTSCKKHSSKRNQKALALWAADCAEHVLPFFEKKFPKDKRPRDAIRAARAWTRGETRVGAARAAALAAHAAARDAARDCQPAACAAARAAGHAAAVAHVASHAPGAAIYALKAVDAAGESVEKEGALQRKRFPKCLRSWLKAWIKSKKSKTRRLAPRKQLKQRTSPKTRTLLAYSSHAIKFYKLQN